MIMHNLSLTLTKRNNYFKVNGCLSSLLPVVSGVLLGSILGPLLLDFRCCMYPQPCRLKLLMILNACTYTRILCSYTSSQLASDQILLQNDINVLAIFDYDNPWHRYLLFMHTILSVHPLHFQIQLLRTYYIKNTEICKKTKQKI